MLAAKEVIFIRELLIDLGFSINGASVINCDSKSAVGMAFDPVAFKKTHLACRRVPSRSRQNDFFFSLACTRWRQGLLHARPRHAEDQPTRTAVSPRRPPRPPAPTA